MKSIKLMSLLLCTICGLTAHAFASQPETNNAAEPQVDILLLHGTIITVDSDNSTYPDGYILVKDGVITGIGPYSKEIESTDAKERIDATGKIIIPGLINAHTHAAMTLFRGLADDLKLEDWLQNHIWPAENKYMDKKAVRLGTELAIAEMLLSGTTTFNDMYFFEDVVAQVAKNTGMRAVVGEAVLGFPTPSSKTPAQSLKHAKKLYLKWKTDPLITAAIAPQSQYTCTGEDLQAARKLADKYGMIYHIHLSETAQSVKDCRKKNNMTPVEYLDSLGVLNENTVVAHCVHLTPEDIKILREKNVKVVHNPGSNLKLASGIAHVTDMQKNGICVGLGTDGAASNNNLDMFKEMALTAKIHKIVDLDPTAMKANTVLRMATIDSAKALGMDQQIGSLEKGKKADICLIDTKKCHLAPMYNPVSHLVYAANGSDVSDVIVDGKVLVKDRNLLTLDTDDLIHRAQSFANKISNQQ